MATTNNQKTTSNTDVSKFKAITDKLRLEIETLRTALATEKQAVRTLKAQNEKNLRQYKSDLVQCDKQFKAQLKLFDNSNKLMDKCTIKKRDRSNENNCDGSECVNCCKLIQEIKVLRSNNKELDDKLQNVIEADRLKASDLRAQHESHTTELTRLKRCSRSETQRLLEELKTKDRIINQLKNTSNKQIRNRNSKSTQTTNLMRKLITNDIQITEIQNDCSKLNGNEDNNVSQNCITSLTVTPVTVTTPTIIEQNNNVNTVIISSSTVPHIYQRHNDTTTQQPVYFNTDETINLWTQQLRPNDDLQYSEHILSTSSVEQLVQTPTDNDNMSTSERLLATTDTCDLAANSTNINNSIRSFEFSRNTIHSNDEQIDKNTTKDENHVDQSTNKHRKELYYRPLIDLESTTVEEDTDSAVSSAPSSLSPQPYHHVTNNVQNFDNFTNESTTTTVNSTIHRHQTTVPSTQVSQSTVTIKQQQNTCDIDKSNESNVWFRSTTSKTPIWYRPEFQLENDFDSECRLENSTDLQSELTIAKRQVRELERALLVTREVKSHNNYTKQNEVVQQALTERIRRLEAREADLLTEIQELREQNELQEFRILELEECHEKWSLRSQSSSELRDIELSRGVTPLPQQDSVSMPSLEYKGGSGDVVREHLVTMTKRTIDPDDKHCLQQVLALLDNLETLSQEHANCLDDYTNEYYSANKFQQRNDSKLSNNQRMIATVLPFIETAQHCDDDFTKNLLCLKKKQLSNASSLQESGIFEECLDTVSVETQTDDSADLTSELNAEIQKLNQIRETIEESKIKTPKNCLKELEYYRMRNELLENKINVYESSGDDQIKKLQERLNNEIKLSTEHKQLEDLIAKLELKNKQLEEECCELEEAENDTRLRAQNLEADLKLISERLRDVEEARSANKRKFREAKSLASYWESMFSRYEERNYELEEYHTELQCRWDSLEGFLPLIILFNLWSYVQMLPSSANTIKCNKATQKTDGLVHELNEALETSQKLRETVQNLDNKCKHLEEQLRHKSFTNRAQWRNTKDTTDNVINVDELIEQNNELKKQLEQLEQREMAFIETLQQADNIWAEMETGYKKRIHDAEENESQLLLQLRQLEDNEKQLRKANIPLVERIQELEDVEKRLEERICHYEKEQKYLLKEKMLMKEELNTAKTEWRNIKENLEGSLHNEMDRLRQKVRQLQEEKDVCTEMLNDTEEAAQKEISILKIQLSKANKELVHLDITNSELRETITQLETRISELQTALIEQRLNSDRTIKNLTSELTQRDRQCLFRKRSFAECTNSAQPINSLSLREELVQKKVTSDGGSGEPNDDGLNVYFLTT